MQGEGDCKQHVSQAWVSSFASQKNGFNQPSKIIQLFDCLVNSLNIVKKIYHPDQNVLCREIPQLNDGGKNFAGKIIKLNGEFSLATFDDTGGSTGLSMGYTYPPVI